MLPHVLGKFSDDIAIDLGTANTLVYALGRGLIIDEPSLVCVRYHGGGREVLAVGATAKRMIGRAPEAIEAVRPLRDGVIADFVATEIMLRDFISRAKSALGFIRPRILICVPSGATPVERRAVYETALSAGARRVYLIEEPVAALLGAGLQIEDTASFMVVDIGGGTTDIAVLARGGVLQTRSLKFAGNAIDEAIVRHIRRTHQLLIRDHDAERIKIEAGAATHVPNSHWVEVHIRGRDLKTGRGKQIVLGPRDVAEALVSSIEQIAEFTQRAIEDLPAAVSSEVCRRGIQITGGGALLPRLDVELSRRVGVPFRVPPEPMLCVVKGTAAVLEDLDAKRHLTISI